MDVRFSAEQVALRDAARVVAGRHGVHALADLEDQERAAKLDAAVHASGWRELRTAVDGGAPCAPWASAVEVAIVAEELGRGLADAPFVGPTMAADLRRLAGAPLGTGPETVLLGPDLSGSAAVHDDTVETGAAVLDGRDAVGALVLRHGQGGVALGLVALDPDGARGGVDLTRSAPTAAGGSAVRPVEGQTRTLGPEEIAGWQALGLAVTAADLVGVMDGALALACDYARTRRQYGAAIGSFQAVQHMLADALVAVEGSRSIGLHAAWAVDALPGPEALTAASAAKAYCARAARAVCETSIQVHGGIGNTWDCLAHVFLRRALLSADAFGGVGPSLERVVSARVGEGVGGLR